VPSALVKSLYTEPLKRGATDARETPGEYAQALAWLADDADLTTLLDNREDTFAILGLAEDLLQTMHLALVQVRHQPVDDTQRAPLQRVRAKLLATAQDEVLDSIVGQVRMFTVNWERASQP
jgi:hypothetical protein